ncbi:MAG: hypothetical protein HZB29_04440 [Nitrospinae bacterium]|nr:hypothetical protein [Nitrospinota bacterium]
MSAIKNRSCLFPVFITFMSLTCAAAQNSYAFPPYNSTDAGTADTWAIEWRLGSSHSSDNDGENHANSLLARFNVGLPSHLEIISEFKYGGAPVKLDEMGMGLKWVPLHGAVNMGVEVLIAPPLEGENRAGVEAVYLASVYWGSWAMHMNAGGFSDERPARPERGWKAGYIIENDFGVLRPGAEIFGKGAESGESQAYAGFGVIIPIEAFDMRCGFDWGLNAASSAFIANIWVTGKRAPAAD